MAPQSGFPQGLVVAVPSYQTLMLPMLRLIGQGAARMADCLPQLAAEFALTEDEVNALLPSGKQTVLSNRAHWARQYLSQAGLVRSERRGSYVLTPDGQALLDARPDAVTNETLRRYPAFLAWVEGSRAAGGTEASVAPIVVAGEADETPDDAIERAHAALETRLQAEVLEAVRQVTPQQFERLILALLSAMGYGAGDLSRAMMTKATGDGGIDGIIHEDALGLDAVYVQAKLYAPENRVGRPAVQQFIGSLTGEGATKGVFVTTSGFSAEARGYLGKVQHRVVLIDGPELARLMVRHGVGVRPRATYVVKALDGDWFDALA